MSCAVAVCASARMSRVLDFSSGEAGSHGSHSNFTPVDQSTCLGSSLVWHNLRGASMMRLPLFTTVHGTRRRALNRNPVGSTFRSLASASGTSNRTERPRRSLFSVPGADQRFITKAQGLKADAVVLDLEDGVAYDRKDAARDLVQQTLLDSSQNFGSAELCVRINGLVESSPPPSAFWLYWWWYVLRI